MNLELKKKLQAEIVWASTRSGAFQRSRIYGVNASDNRKLKFRTATKEFLFTEVFLKYYNSQITELKLKATIEKFINQNAGNSSLKRKQLRYGNAQKFVNLYLKCMWILGYLKTPPHFPVDRIILGQLKIKGNWTDMNREKYDEIISRAKKKLDNTGYNTIAEWEALEYQDNYLERNKGT